jgi:integrase
MNRKTAITERLLQAKPKPAGARYTVWDTVLPGFAVRVSAKGKRTFYIVKRRAGARQVSWVSLGTYPVVSLAVARERGREALGTLIEGKDPNVEAARRRTRAKPTTFAEVAEIYIRDFLPFTKSGLPKRDATAGARTLRREVLPVLGHLPAAEVGHEQIVELLQSIARRTARVGARLASGGPHTARRLRTMLSGLFQWAAFARVGGITANPMAAIPAGEVLRGISYTTRRSRVLTDAELRLVWRAATETPYPYGTLIRALIMSGQRLEEIAQARWSEIDEDAGCLVIPAERMKNRIMHALPLTPRMRALLAELPRWSGGDYIFTTTAGAKPFSGFSKRKTGLDAKIAQLGEVGHWRVHDLRRTARTGMAAAGVQVFFAELVIAHQQSGVHATYDLHRYDAEKLDALMKWEARLFQIVEPAPAVPNVLPLPVAAAG